jgi:hypothetical protein
MECTLDSSRSSSKDWCILRVPLDWICGKGRRMMSHCTVSEMNKLIWDAFVYKESTTVRQNTYVRKSRKKIVELISLILK